MQRRKPVVRGRRGREGQEGQALVEFALVVPVLLILFLGIMEFGLLMYNQQIITNASREGARFGIVVQPTRRTVSEIEGVVADYCGSHLVTFGSGSPSVIVTPDPTTGAVFGDDLTVAVEFPYDFLLLPEFVSGLTGGQTLRAESTMKYE
jgi:Flp pilus assembly protein TadG